jgi:hypothetical protein
MQLLIAACTADSRRMRCGVLCCVVQSERDRRDVNVDPHTLVFSPPYESEAQAIEKVWAKMKQYVAKKDNLKRTPTEVRQHIADGFYGCSDFDGVTAGDCVSYVSHAQGTMNSWILSIPALAHLFPAGTAAADMTVDNISHAMRQKYYEQRPQQQQQQQTYSDSSASDDSSSDSDWGA